MKNIFVYSTRIEITPYEEGDCEEGNFVIVCNQCEYSLSFSAIICRQYPESSIGTIHNLYDFSKIDEEKILKEYHLKKDDYLLMVGRCVPENNYELVIKDFMKSKIKKKLVIITQ